MFALASERGLAALEFLKPDRVERLDARRTRWFPPHTIVDGPHRILDEARSWLDCYFNEPSSAPMDITLDLRGNEFELAVWAALLQVKCGCTSTYGRVASDLGRPLAARAVGLAVGSNPVSLIVPCHRIVGSTGSLTGYGGGLDRKRWLLDHEAGARSYQTRLPL
jgi:methylated-DNA-[protein]-cysteine S-methyltransferase